MPGWLRRAPQGGRRRAPRPEGAALGRTGAAPAAPLDLYAKLVGLPGKEDVAGSDVQALYAQGALDRIAAYCMTDVVQTWLLFLRYRLVEGSLTPDGYEESVALAREALPALFARRLPPEERAVLDGVPRALRAVLRRRGTRAARGLSAAPRSETAAGAARRPDDTARRPASLQTYASALRAALALDAERALARRAARASSSSGSPPSSSSGSHASRPSVVPPRGGECRRRPVATRASRGPSASSAGTPR